MTRVKEILQFRLSLVEVSPTVWRRIQVPADCTLTRFHRVIQATMGWQDYHLHEFTIRRQVYGDPEVDEEDRLLDDRDFRLKKLDLAIGERIEYAYDFGDNWQHVLELEDKLPASAGAVYPRCVGGERSAPPEDVGGVSGYEEF